MEYKFLSEDQQKQIKEQTLANIEAEHFSATLALERVSASGEDAEPLKARIDALEKQYAALAD